ncbi:MFS transporter [Janibacter limosus]|uniref:MFS transporter n=3 Tax=Janibacter limosus TaxID=53458 RepID=A0A4P6MX15_9MICO|nr:MFS transporter [Janibacter limosus]QBF47602.1 MFS transporter [Janibacter limosus]
MTTTTPDARPTTTGSGVVGLMAALLSAIFAFQLSASMLSPVLATMERELEATSAQVGVTQTAFFASAALFSLFLPRWGDLVGRKRLMLGMLAVTTVGSVVSALAPSVGVLGPGRVVMGISGPIVPMALIMLRVQVPDARRYAQLMAVLTAVNGGIAGVDALAGGWLAASWGFRSVFWAMAAVSVIALVAVALGTRESRSERTMPMDWTGVTALVVVLAALYFALDEAGKVADARWLVVLALVVVAAVAFAVFWQLEQRVAHPLVTTGHLRQRRTWALLGTTLLTMSGVFAVMNGLLPNIAQDPGAGIALGADVVSWWTLTPYALAGLVMGPVAGQLAARFGYARVLRVGLGVSIAALVGTALLVESLTPALLLGVFVVVGLGYAGTCNIMLNGLGVVLSPRDNQGYLPGMNSGAFNLGAGLSFALLFGVDTAVGSAVGTAAGYRAGILTGAVLLVLALGLSLLIPRPDEADGGGEDPPSPA